MQLLAEEHEEQLHRQQQARQDESLARQLVAAEHVGGGSNFPPEAVIAPARFQEGTGGGIGHDQADTDSADATDFVQGLLETEEASLRLARQLAEADALAARQTELESLRVAQELHTMYLRECEEAQRRQRQDEELARTLQEEQLAEREQERQRQAEAAARTCYVCEDDDQPAQQLRCSHYIHIECAKECLRRVANPGDQVIFLHARCGQCRKWFSHASLDPEVQPVRMLYDRVFAMALQQCEREGIALPPAVQAAARAASAAAGRGNAAAPAAQDELIVEVDGIIAKSVFYRCFRCKQPYYGGSVNCVEDALMTDEERERARESRICAMCSCGGKLQNSVCPKHGQDFIQFKCRYCCRPAVWFCFGTTHFCNPCHNPVNQRVIPCPGPPACHGQHPPNDGNEACLGCALCRDGQIQ